MSKTAFALPPGGLRLRSTRARALPLADYLENLSERAVRGEFRAKSDRKRGAVRKNASRESSRNG
jgi:hypothetical protein